MPIDRDAICVVRVTEKIVRLVVMWETLSFIGRVFFILQIEESYKSQY